MLAPRGVLLSLANQNGRLDQGDYHTRVNDILLRQRSALQVDDIKADTGVDDVTDIFEEAAQPPVDEVCGCVQFI